MRILQAWTWLPDPFAHRLAFPGDARREAAERRAARKAARAERRKERARHRSATPDAAELGGALRVFRGAALWAIAVLITAASAASFAESYRGLYEWATRHSLADFWAAAFPLQVDLFIGVGELVLFVAMVDGWQLRHRLGAWSTALLGLAASIAGNVGHVEGADMASRVTAAVPPLAAFAALWLGMTVLKRITVGRRKEPAALRAYVPSSAEAAAMVSLRATLAAGNPWSGRQLETRFGLTRAQATKVRDLVLAESNGHGSEDSADDAER